MHHVIRCMQRMNPIQGQPNKQFQQNLEDIISEKFATTVQRVDVIGSVLINHLRQIHPLP